MADVFTKALPTLPFVRLTTNVLGDRFAVNQLSEFRGLCRQQELAGGSIRAVHNAARARLAESKAAAKASKAKRREETLTRRGDEHAAIIQALNAQIEITRHLLGDPSISQLPMSLTQLEQATSSLETE